jgi:NUDIX domain
MNAAKRELLEETGYIAKEIQHFYTYHPSISKSRQLVHIFMAKDLVEDKSNHDGAEDITRVEIVSVEQLKHLIKLRKIESAGTLIAYLVCCAGIIIWPESKFNFDLETKGEQGQLNINYRTGRAILFRIVLTSSFAPQTCCIGKRIVERPIRGSLVIFTFIFVIQIIYHSSTWDTGARLK